MTDGQIQEQDWAMASAQEKLEELRETVREYLKYASMDGKLERRPLREKLNQLISK